VGGPDRAGCVVEWDRFGLSFMGITCSVSSKNINK
jgi:hypothetical protein